jgi:hypothetical protein
MKEEIQERIAASLEVIAESLEQITKQEYEMIKQHKDQFESMLTLRKLELSMLSSRDDLLKQEIEKQKTK